jgi:hypothetical protein
LAPLPALPARNSVLLAEFRKAARPLLPPYAPESVNWKLPLPSSVATSR